MKVSRQFRRALESELRRLVEAQTIDLPEGYRGDTLPYHPRPLAYDDSPGADLVQLACAAPGKSHKKWVRRKDWEKAARIAGINPNSFDLDRISKGKYQI